MEWTTPTHLFAVAAEVFPMSEMTQHSFDADLLSQKCIVNGLVWRRTVDAISIGFYFLGRCGDLFIGLGLFLFV